MEALKAALSRPAPHAHHHEHGGAGHHHAPTSFGRAFAVGVTLNTLYIVIETAYGLLSNSVALLADAGHNLSDVLGLLLAWGASALATRAPTSRRTYGYKSSTTLAALANAVLLLVATGAIGWEAIQRLLHPATVETGVVLWVAAAGIVVNGGTAWLFMAGRHDDLNVRGAFLHMAADALVTFGVVVAAVVMAATGWFWLDAAVSLIVAAIILIGTWSLLRDTVNLALQAVPKNIDPEAVRHWLGSLPGITEVHDLHVWALGTSDTALTVHLVREDGGGDASLLLRVQDGVRERFGIAHATVQLETSAIAEACALRPNHVV